MNAMRTTILAVGAAVGFSLASPATAQTPAAAYNGEWLSVSGTVERVAGEMFVLDYGPGTIPVEMDDYDWYNENAIAVGDKVTVTGRMDDDFFQTRRIEASTVYVDSLHTLFYASAADEEDVTVPVIDIAVLRSGGIALTGTVQSIAGDEMTVDTGAFDYKVDTGSLGYDPFDADGAQHIAIGERVSVTGRVDDADLFERREIDATSLIELSA